MTRLEVIVEGDGEVQALPLLVRTRRPDIVVGRPILVARSSFVKMNDYFERYVELARRKGPDAILVLLDSDDDCPAELGPRLREQVSAKAGGIAVSVVLAHHEYEAWFLAAGSDLGLPDHEAPESVRGAKERVASSLGRYSPTVDQAGLTARLLRCDLDRVRRDSPSFDKLFRDLDRLPKADQLNPI